MIAGFYAKGGVGWWVRFTLYDAPSGEWIVDQQGEPVVVWMELAKSILMGDLPWRQELADGVNPPLLPRQERHRADSIVGGEGDPSPAQAQCASWWGSDGFTQNRIQPCLSTAVPTPLCSNQTLRLPMAGSGQAQ